MATLDFNIKKYSKNFHVSINIEEQVEVIQVEIDSAVFLSAMLEQKEEEVIKLLAFIEFTRLDSSGIKKRKPKKFVEENEFKEKLKVLLEVKSIEDIIDDISDMKYYEILEYFFEDEESFEEYLEESEEED